MLLFHRCVKCGKIIPSQEEFPTGRWLCKECEEVAYKEEKGEALVDEPMDNEVRDLDLVY